MRSPTHQERSSSPPRVATRFMGESSQQGRHFTPSWTPIISYPLHPIYDYNVVMWVQYQQSFHPRWEGPRKPALDRILRSTQDRLPPRQYGQNHEEVGPVSRSLYTVKSPYPGGLLNLH
jgi:hypothetical protein